MTETQKLLPAKGLFMHGKVPEPLSEEERQWLVEQLHHWPNRVNEARTCAIGALADMAITEFCRLMAERPSPSESMVEVLREAREAIVRAVWIIEDAEKDTNWCSGDPYSDEGPVKDFNALLPRIDAALKLEATDKEVG